jgi:hypothetical protein
LSFLVLEVASLLIILDLIPIEICAFIPTKKFSIYNVFDAVHSFLLLVSMLRSVVLGLNVVLMLNVLPILLNFYNVLGTLLQFHIALLLQFLWVSLLVSDYYWFFNCVFLLVILFL